MKVTIIPEKAQVIAPKEINITLSPNQAAFIGCIIGDLNHSLVDIAVKNHEEITFNCDAEEIINSDFIYEFYQALKKVAGKENI